MSGSPARALLAAVRFYQRAISPVFPPRCRFHPSCSAYAVEALEVHGAGRGTWLALRRLARCASWHPGGADFVPERAGSQQGGTAETTHSSCTAVQSSEQSLEPEAPGIAEARRPDSAPPPAPRRSAQQEAGVA
ncbi:MULTISPECIES: membrane protein insertion efficiency factor YidD [unclassified Modestobacter]